jgi:hypothetical protein
LIHSVVLFSSNLAEWATAAMECLIAAVIYWELEENRRSNFQMEAANEINYRSRNDIYSDFFGTEGSSFREKSEKFCQRVWENKDLKSRCEQHILLFNRLGQIRRYALFHRRDYIRLFPHTVVLFWMMLQPYIEERRSLSGEWWGNDFRDLTEACLRYLLRNPDRKLCLYDGDRGRRNDLFIPTSDLRQLQELLISEKRKMRK